MEVRLPKAVKGHMETWGFNSKCIGRKDHCPSSYGRWGTEPEDCSQVLGFKVFAPLGFRLTLDLLLFFFLSCFFLLELAHLSYSYPKTVF